MEARISFSDNLFNNFQGVYNHSQFSKDRLKDLIQFFKDRANIEDQYARGLERLSSSKPMDSSSLSKAISVLRYDCLTKSMQSRSLVENIRSDILSSLNSLLSEQKEAIKQTGIDGKNLERERNALADKQLRGKMRYFKACSECERIVSDLESSFDPRREKIIDKLSSSKRQVEASFTEYSSSVAESAEFFKNYTHLMHNILNAFQDQEEERSQAMKDALRKLVVYETAQLRNLQYDVETLALNMEKVNFQEDLEMFIKTNQRDENLEPEEFCAFDGIHSSFKNLKGIPVISIPLPVNEVMTHFDPINQSLDDFFKAQLDSILTKVWNEEELGSDDYIQFNSAIKDPVGRKAWIWVLSNKKGEVSEFIFNQLSELFLSWLNECERSRDINSIKNCIHLSQCFYTESKTMIQTPIAYHSIWANYEIWEMVIQSTIDTEILKYKEFGFSGSPEETETLVKNIAFVQLGSFAQSMIGLKVDSIVASEILSKHACKHDLSTKDIDVLMATLEQKQRKSENSENSQEVIRGRPQWLSDNKTAPRPLIRK